MTDALIKARNLVSGFMLPERITDPALADDLALAIADLLTAPQALAGEIMRDKLAELQNAGVKSLTINQIVGLLGFSETEAAQPASPLRGREPLRLSIYVVEGDEQFVHFATYGEIIARVPATSKKGIALLKLDAALSASPPDLSSRSAAKAEQPETRQQKNEREMAEGSRCDGSCNDGMPCHCQPAADPVTGRDEVLVPRELTAGNGAKTALIGEFSETFEYMNDEGNQCTLQIPVSWTTIKEIHKAMVAHFSPAAPEPELPAARPMGQS